MLEKFSGFQIAEQIKIGEITSSEVVTYFIDQIQSVNSKLNAVVETRFDQARKEAKECDQRIKNGEKNLGPLFGVPFTLKEMISADGLKNTLGSVHYKNRISDFDATAVSRLKKAGAILLGTTNVPEVGFWFECDNPIYGFTKNPYDLTRTSGGSSGGEGAIIGAGASPFGLGSDIGGSIRMPAFFCGIFGHKPSDKIVPMTGHFPVYPKTAHEMTGAKYPFTVIGPMSRKASDLYDLMNLIVGPDEFDRETRKDFKLKPRVTNWSKIKVYTLPSPVIHGTSAVDPSLSKVVVDAGKHFESLGAFVEELPDKIMISGFEAWTGRTWSMEGRDFENYLAAGNKIELAKEFFKLATGRRSYTFPSLLTAFVDRYMSDKDMMKDVYLKDLEALRKNLQTVLGENSILIMPPHPRQAPKHHTTYARPFDFAFTGVINGLGFPATCAPMGLHKGLPLGIQIVANDGQDHLTLSAAEQIEKGFGGWQAPTTFRN